MTTLKRTTIQETESDEMSLVIVVVVVTLAIKLNLSVLKKFSIFLLLFFGVIRYTLV